MKRPFLRAGLVFGMLALAQAGCHHTDKVKTTDYTPKKADDPTAWTDKDVTRGSSDSGAGNSGLAPGSGIKGTWSSEGQEIERSLGVGK
jgi:hypothetical protein